VSVCWPLRVAATCFSLGLLAAACSEDGASPQSGSSRIRVPELVARSGSQSRRPVRPRWERVVELTGRARATRPLRIADRAIQWRMHFECEGGRLFVDIVSVADHEEASFRRKCPGAGTRYAIMTGRLVLSVEAEGRWGILVEQQVDTPLLEPPLPAIGTGTSDVVAEGRFYDVELEGSGKAYLHRLPGNRYVIRLEDFWVTPNVDLELWSSTLRRPQTSAEIVRAPHRPIAFLKATAGAHNYLLPRGMDVARMRSVAIWCQLTHQMYAAAPLSS
jgi:hypothetical protein